MNTHIPHSNAWIGFSYLSFIAAIGMIGMGILLIPGEIWIKAYFAMAVVMLIQACITLTKTVRDAHESGRLLNRLDDAKAEQLLMNIDRGKA